MDFMGVQLCDYGPVYGDISEFRVSSACLNANSICTRLSSAFIRPALIREHEQYEFLALGG